MKKVDIFSQQISTPKNNEENGFTMLNNMSISLVKCKNFSDKKINNLFKNEEIFIEDKESVCNTNYNYLKFQCFNNLEEEFKELKETYSNYLLSFRNKIINYSAHLETDIPNKNLFESDRNIRNVITEKSKQMPKMANENNKTINKFDYSDISSFNQNIIEDDDIIVYQINHIHNLLFNIGENNSNNNDLTKKLNEIIEFIENKNIINRWETKVIHDITTTYHKDYDFINKLKSESVKSTFKRKIANIYDKIEKLQLSLRQIDDQN